MNNDNKPAGYPTPSGVQHAKSVISEFAHNTPVLTSKFFNKLVGGELFFKCENLQKSGSFKFRGATNAVYALSNQERSKGVATHSSGNFGQALALVAKLNKLKAYIVMPANAPKAKFDATKSYGAEVIVCEPTLEAREETLAEVTAKTGASFIHPYNDYKIIEGQSSAMMELIDELKIFDNVIAPVGGGGLISGTIIARDYFANNVKVFAAEPKNADDAYKSWVSKKFVPSLKPDTICDGLKTSLGDKTFPIIMNGIEEIITAEEEFIAEVMRMVWERMKIIIEPSSAVALAAILKKPDNFRSKKTAVIFSGGNVDLYKLPWC